MVTEAAHYGLLVARDVMVPMRDGVRLATDIYWPASAGERAPGRWPAILGRTSYDKCSPQLWVRPVAEFFVPRGYVVLLQDLRGRHRSEGRGQYFHTVNPHEGADGYDTIEWIAAQPWSNGRIGMTGSSHGAIVQQVAALHRPPHLTTIWPDVGPTNIYAHEAREGGAMAFHMFGALFLHAHDAQEIADDPAAQAIIDQGMADLRQWVYRTPFQPGATPLRVVPNLEATLFNYYYRGAYDDYWAQECANQEAYFDRHADIPAVLSGGWHDPFSIATTTYYAALAARNRSPQRLIMGPWTHTSMRGSGESFAGDVDFGPAAVWGDRLYNQQRAAWFDRWLRDTPATSPQPPAVTAAPTGPQSPDTAAAHAASQPPAVTAAPAGCQASVSTVAGADAPVRLFVMGGGSGRRTASGRLDHGGGWRAEREWPLARTQWTNFYLQDDGRLTPTPPTAETASRSFRFDPAHPVPTIAGTVTGFYELVPLPEGLNAAYVPPRARMRSLVLPGAADQVETPAIVGARPPYPRLADRPDVLVFQTAPLVEPIELTGPLSVELWVSSTAVDTDFTAKLIDLYPPNDDYPAGYAMNLVDSIIRCRFRDGWRQERPMTPGQRYRVVITLPPTSNLFAVGHCLRLDISSSNFPRFDVNPNTGEPLGRHTHQLVATNTIHLDRSHPSHLIVPVIPAPPLALGTMNIVESPDT
jgi:hypothetical protein